MSNMESYVVQEMKQWIDELYSQIDSIDSKIDEKRKLSKILEVKRDVILRAVEKFSIDTNRKTAYLNKYLKPIQSELDLYYQKFELQEMVELLNERNELLCQVQTAEELIKINS
ncbi:hypothetical protein [Lysinibacillus agricola]|uniref:hypothetical protein n=1 Tax=Lysinibacillus agricola TaxID=2590012 RepID=UPI003C18752B